MLMGIPLLPKCFIMQVSQLTVLRELFSEYWRALKKQGHMFWKPVTTGLFMITILRMRRVRKLFDCFQMNELKELF